MPGNANRADNAINHPEIILKISPMKPKMKRKGLMISRKTEHASFSGVAKELGEGSLHLNDYT